MSTDVLASVVIPAHNEDAVLGRCLTRLLASTAPGELDVVVVANGCHDRTADVAREAGVRVIETANPGKANALRLGDAACHAFPRVYLDADVELTGASVRTLVEAMTSAGALACAPVPQWDLRHAGWVARRVHRVHDQLVGPRRALAGVGVYLLSEAGHRRATPIPDVISDDGWVHRSFAPDERLVVPQARCVVRPAGSVRAHLRRRVRVRLGNQELDRLGLPAPEDRLRLNQLTALLAARSVGVVDATCYLLVLLADRLLTGRRAAEAGQVRWATDVGSRLA